MIMLFHKSHHFPYNDDFGAYIFLSIEELHKAQVEQSHCNAVNNACPHKFRIQLVSQNDRHHKQDIYEKIKLVPHVSKPVLYFVYYWPMILAHHLKIRNSDNVLGAASGIFWFFILLISYNKLNMPYHMPVVMGLARDATPQMFCFTFPN